MSYRNNVMRWCVRGVTAIVVLHGAVRGEGEARTILPCTITPKAPEAPVVSIDIDEDGRIQVQKDGAQHGTTLTGLRKELLECATQYDLEQKRKGRTGYKSTSEGRSSMVIARVHATPATPWLHVCWLTVVCLECNIATLELCVGDRVLQMGLPPNSSVQLPSVDASRLVAVDVVVRDEKEVTRNGEIVKLAKSVTYLVGKRPVGTVAELATCVRSDVERIGANECVGVVGADNTVPVECVVEVLDIVASSGVRRFDVMSWAEKIPTSADREREMLKFPRRDGR